VNNGDSFIAHSSLFTRYYFVLTHTPGTAPRPVAVDTAGPITPWGFTSKAVSLVTGERVHQKVEPYLWAWSP
jgi:hypothetical protein